MRGWPRRSRPAAAYSPPPTCLPACPTSDATLAIYLSEPAKALSALRYARDYLTGVGPKATLTARAHRMAGNEEAARSDIKAALRLVEERLAVRPNDTLLLANKAQILALQGDKTAVEPLLREIRQRMSAGDRSMRQDYFAYLLMLSNEPEAALGALELFYEFASSEYQSKVSAATSGAVAYYGKASEEYRSKIGLRYDPVWAPLRGNPRFEALLKAPEAKK